MRHERLTNRPRAVEASNAPFQRIGAALTDPRGNALAVKDILRDNGVDNATVRHLGDTMLVDLPEEQSVIEASNILAKAMDLWARDQLTIRAGNDRVVFTKGGAR